MIEAFREVVGHSRQEVSTYLLEKFDLEKLAGARMTEFDVDSALVLLDDLVDDGKSETDPSTNAFGAGSKPTTPHTRTTTFVLGLEQQIRTEPGSGGSSGSKT